MIISEIKNIRNENIDQSSVESIVVETECGLGVSDAEVLSVPGVVGKPANTDTVIITDLETGGVQVAIAHKNYKINISLSDGETALYSTDNSGNLKSVIKLDDEGNIDFNGNSKKLVTHAELNTALQSFVFELNALFATKQDTPGSPGTLSLDISSAETQTVRTGG